MISKEKSLKKVENFEKLNKVLSVPWNKQTPCVPFSFIACFMRKN